ncbi:MAG: trypsin-like serine protease, partial [Polyangiaceae bacterium]|nr:trypsin-like serine protease [Polyangiaceae bacterium]
MPPALRVPYLALLIVVSACASEAEVGSVAAPVVYGVDGREDVYAAPSALFRSIARDAIVTMVRPGVLLPNLDGTFTPGFYPLSERINATYGEPLCPGERFGEQTTIGLCSGTLIDDDLVLTAGHCFDGSECGDESFVFDYFYGVAGILEEIDSDDIYACREIVVRRLDEDNPGADYAVVRLDRPVVGRTPAPVDVRYEVAASDPLTVIG